ncbi:MAG: nucleotide pyrophosphatase, partial [Anaerolineales bacterium]
DSRSGNHTPQGFLLAVGGPFEPVRALPDIQLEDIAPTLVDLLGAEAPPGLAGTSLMRKSSTQA